MSMDRRKFLRLAGASALLIPGLAQAKKAKKKKGGGEEPDHTDNGMPRKTPIPETEAEKEFDKLSAKDRAAKLGRPIAHPYNITPGEAKLPPWDLGRNSSSDKWMLMFRGNASHTFYGSGTVAAEPKLLWKFRMADFSTLHHGTPFVWKGTGWSGQSLRYGDYVWVGSTGGHFHCFEAQHRQAGLVRSPPSACTRARPASTRTGSTARTSTTTCAASTPPTAS